MKKARDKAQQFLDFSGRARRDDPATSHAAARRVGEFGHVHHAVILTALEARGPATIYELAERTGLDHVAVARRMSELAGGVPGTGRVHRTGETRPGPTGRQCDVWAHGPGVIGFHRNARVIVDEVDTP